MYQEFPWCHWKLVWNACCSSCSYAPRYWRSETSTQLTVIFDLFHVSCRYDSPTESDPWLFDLACSENKIYVSLICLGPEICLGILPVCNSYTSSGSTSTKPRIRCIFCKYGWLASCSKILIWCIAELSDNYFVFENSFYGPDNLATDLTRFLEEMFQINLGELSVISGVHSALPIYIIIILVIMYAQFDAHSYIRH